MKASRALLGGLTLATLAAAAWGFARHDREARVVRPERRDLVVRVAVEGELVAAATARLGPPALAQMWNFKLSFLAPEGAEVAAGDPVLGFDATELRQQLASKTAERERAEKELEKRTLETHKERRAKTLQRAEADARLRRAELKLSVPAEIEAEAALEQARIDRDLALLELASIDAGLAHLETSARAELDSLARNRDRAAARVAEIEAQIAALEVAAPRAGTVIYRASRGREKPKIGDTIWRAQTVIEIPDLDSLHGDASVAEADAGKVAVDQPASLTFDAFPDTIVTGWVASVRRTVQTKPNGTGEKIMRLAIALDPRGTERLRPGMRFRGTLEVARLADALVVPHEAIAYGPEGAELRLRTGLGSEVVRPTFGAADEGGVAVLAGLDEDARLELRDAGAAAP